MERAMILDWLEDNESPPSAACLVKCIVEGELSDEVTMGIYEISSGECDTLTAEYVDKMDFTQLNRLLTIMDEIDHEKSLIEEDSE